MELLIIDKAERLWPSGRERLRDRFDRLHFGLVLIGMPGIDTASRAICSSTAGSDRPPIPPAQRRRADLRTFAPLEKLGLTLDLGDFKDAQAVAAVGRVTRGNFRLIQRLFTQIERVMRMNKLQVITTEVVDAARSTLVIGVT